jgi:hypothetical protein
MLEFLGFGRAKNDAHNTHDNTDTIPATRPMPGEYPTPTQREMVRLTLHTLLKRHGIPVNWLGAEMGAFPTAVDPDAILLQLIIQHWHPGFGLYAPALQSELMEGLKRFDPTATATRYHIHWKFAQDSGCPHASLPESAYWTQPAAAAKPAVRAAPLASATPVAPLPMQPMPAHRPKFALPESQADHHSGDDGDDDPDQGFAATQMHDIR